MPYDFSLGLRPIFPGLGIHDKTRVEHNNCGMRNGHQKENLFLCAASFLPQLLSQIFIPHCSEIRDCEFCSIEIFQKRDNSCSQLIMMHRLPTSKYENIMNLVFLYYAK